MPVLVNCFDIFSWLLVQHFEADLSHPHSNMRGSRKFIRGGPTLTHFFYFDEGRKDKNTTISGSSSATQRNAISMAFPWRADDGLTLNAGLDPDQYC